MNLKNKYIHKLSFEEQIWETLRGNVCCMEKDGDKCGQTPLYKEKMMEKEKSVWSEHDKKYHFWCKECAKFSINDSLYDPKPEKTKQIVDWTHTNIKSYEQKTKLQK